MSASRLRVVAVALAAAAAAVLVAPQSASADDPIVYAALGDSASMGPTTALPYDLSLCSRTVGAYPVLWAADHSVTDFTFHACGGATTVDVINNQLVGLDGDTTLVTVTAGGNDLGVVQAIVGCHLQTDNQCDATWDGIANQAEADLPDLLDAMYEAIHEAAPNARIIQISYPGAFETTSGCAALLELDQAKRISITDAGSVIADVQADRAAANNVTFLDARPFFAGHRICSGTPWVDGLVGVPPYHPNALGHSQGYLDALTSVTG